MQFASILRMKLSLFWVNAIVGSVFIFLKVCGFISWDWWLVLLPFWWELALDAMVALLLIAAMGGILLMLGISDIFKR